MQNTVIIDLVLAAVLIGFTVVGAVRGLYRTLAGLLVLVMALLGASWLTGVCAEGVEDCIRPVLTARMETVAHDALSAQAGAIAEAESLQSLEELLQRFGWQGDLGDTLLENTEGVLAEAEKKLAQTLVESILPPVVSGVLKAVFFLLLFVALKLISRLLQPLIEHLPVLRQFNKLFGGAAGLLQGILILFVVIWVAERLGFAAAPALAGSKLLSLFIR